MTAVVFALFYLLAAFALFWIIRLAVRYGVDDALTKHRTWLDRGRAHPSGTEESGRT
ncbi:MAG TPA: hypothetical protein VFR99_11885 [Marmoricola sp.]|nr:hypothetical protein [Marmoricola sp.]